MLSALEFMLLSFGVVMQIEVFDHLPVMKPLAADEFSLHRRTDDHAGEHAACPLMGSPRNLALLDVFLDDERDDVVVYRTAAGIFGEDQPGINLFGFVFLFLSRTVPHNGGPQPSVLQRDFQCAIRTLFVPEGFIPLRNQQRPNG